MCDRDSVGVSSIFKVIRNDGTLDRMFPTYDLSCEDTTARWKWNQAYVYYESRKREVKMQTELLKLQKIVYYESRKRELKIRLMNKGRCDVTLKARVEECTYLTYTGLHDKTN